jgi:hypothetical protein
VVYPQESASYPQKSDLPVDKSLDGMGLFLYALLTIRNRPSGRSGLGPPLCPPANDGRAV